MEAEGGNVLPAHIMSLVVNLIIPDVFQGKREGEDTDMLLSRTIPRQFHPQESLQRDCCLIRENRSPKAAAEAAGIAWPIQNEVQQRNGSR